MARLPRFLRQDFHVHTFRSPCSSDPGQTAAGIVERCEKLGWEAIGFADHYADLSAGQTPPEFYTGCGPEVLAATRREMEAVQTSLQVLYSCEGDQYSESECTVTPALAEQLDYVIVAASHFHLGGAQQPMSDRPADVVRLFLPVIRAAMRQPFTSIIAHPFMGRPHSLPGLGPMPDALSDETLGEVLEEAAGLGVAMELSPGCLRRDLWDADWPERFYGLCRDYGAKIATGTDAHRLTRLESTPELLPLVEGLGLAEQDFVCWDDLQTCTLTASTGRKAHG